MTKFLSIKPAEYFEQGMTGCGGYSAKAILSALGKDDKDSPYEYYPFRMGIMSSPSRWLRVFRSYNLQAELKKAENDSQLIENIKSNIDDGKMTMIRVGNGYTKSGKWYWLPWIFVGHWITVWGYNDEDESFYVYDSWMPKNTTKLPVGNVMRPYLDLVRDTKGGFPFWWRKRYLSVWK